MRPIDADALKEYILRSVPNWSEDREIMLDCLSNSPTIEERKEGKWIDHGRWLWLDGVRCSNCNHKLQTTGLPSYCPNCKAYMRGGYDATD